MGNRVARLATPCFAGGGGYDMEAAEADDGGGSIGHILSFDGREGPAFAGAIHGVLLPSNQSAMASVLNLNDDQVASLSGSPSFDSSSSFSFRRLQPRQYSGSLEHCTSPSTSGVSLSRQPPRTDEQILADVVATRHRRRFQGSSRSSLVGGGLRRAVASVLRLRVGPCGFFPREKEQDEHFVPAVANGNGGAAIKGNVNVNAERNGGDAADDGARVQWARGKAGEDRVHVVVSKEHGWMFVGIYDGFNGPDAADYLAGNLYAAVCRELAGVLADAEDDPDARRCNGGGLRSGRHQHHRGVLEALARALRRTEEAYFAEAEARAAESPELAMMGSCVLVVVVKGAEVYVMNVGDSRAVLAHRVEPDLSSVVHDGDDLAGVKEEIKRQLDGGDMGELAALQLTMDHSTNVYKEVRRIRSEHLDDPACIVNGRVKGSLKLTRAFGAGYLKEPRWNKVLLEAFQVDYVGSSPYISCRPYLRHHRVGVQDKFLILSSDGLYEYFTNEEVVAQVEAFTTRYPDDDPAKYLSHEILLRAANQAGMGFHELLEVQQGDRRRYHDDVSIIIISLDGKIWRSSA